MGGTRGDSCRRVHPALDSFGPIFPIVVGLLTLGASKRDPFLLAGALASLLAFWTADATLRILLGAPIRNMQPTPDHTVVYGILAAVLAAIALLSMAGRIVSRRPGKAATAHEASQQNRAVGKDDRQA
ncbi:hypothetical protein [Nesterenkonia sp. NBAIMH1]|uniref:hypothetical protein n=1 Tax=Nesterenkonia sp. NBAIMH1 TaxID=2600320 RepID=UPI0011B43A85|nr:hypothetical protein [Nesterenkonia sp. NBAIMH1]